MFHSVQVQTYASVPQVLSYPAKATPSEDKAHCYRSGKTVQLLHISIPRKSDKRYVNFVNNVTITLSDEEKTKIKVIDLDDLYNFVVDDFFS